ncbi:MAG: glycosyltransferase [Patescibacteria group bacterium]|jgi:dolichol-phosphate mannosyltransferase
MKVPLLSIIVPAYLQEKTIAGDLRNIEAVAKQIRYDYEIICVIDGRIDKTYEKAKEVQSSKIKVYGYKKNYGKGYAVRFGMARAKGDLIAFIDAGMEIDPNGLSMVLEHMLWYEADIIVGSKRHPASYVSYPLDRRVVSFLYQLFVRVFTGLNIRDTQAGLKIFRRKVLEKVLGRLLVKRYAFDLEMLVVAHRLGFKRIYEAPIKLNYRFDDLTHAVSLRGFLKENGLWGSFVDTLAIIYRLRFLKYYDDSNKRKWVFDKNLNMRINVG